MVNACRGPAMNYMSTDFDADSSSRLPFIHCQVRKLDGFSDMAQHKPIY